MTPNTITLLVLVALLFSRGCLQLERRSALPLLEAPLKSQVCEKLRSRVSNAAGGQLVSCSPLSEPLNLPGWKWAGKKPPLTPDVILLNADRPCRPACLSSSLPHVSVNLH